MMIKCPECQQQYEIPERFYGKKFYCPQCQTRVRTKALEVGDVTAIQVSPTEPVSESESKTASSPRRRRRTAFQKESAPKPLISSFSLQQICMTIGFVGIAMVLIVVLSALGDKSPGSNGNDSAGAASASDELPSENSQGQDTDRLAQQSNGTAQSTARTNNATARRDPSGRRRPGSSVGQSSGARPSDDSNRGDESELDFDHRLTTDARSDEAMPLNPARAGGGLLGPVPLMDITWETNTPGYSLRVLDSRPLSGMAMEKIARTYGSDDFLKRYRELLDSEDYTVRFYAALGLANFGQADERVLSILLKSIAQSRERHAFRLRVDLANKVIEHYRSRIIPVLHRLVSERDAAVAGFAVEYLSLMGREARDAIPSIAELATRREPYLPANRSLYQTVTLGELARAALRRLAVYAADAIPVLQERMEQEEDPQTRQQILELIAWIGYKTGQGRALDWPAWARSYGIPLLPEDAPSVVAFRMSQLRHVGFDTLPQVAPILDSLRQTTGILPQDVDLVALATYDHGKSLWERRPFVAIVRMNESRTVESIPLTAERKIDGQRVRQLGPETGWQITGERTLVVGTIPELVHTLRKGRSGVVFPNVVIPEDDREPAYLKCSATESRAIYVSEQADGSSTAEAVGRVEQEFWLQPIAATAETLRQQSSSSAAPNGGNNAGTQSTDWWDWRIDQPDAKLLSSGSRLCFEFPLPPADVSAASWLDDLPWRPSNGVALRAWTEFKQQLRIERAPYTDAAGLVRPEMGDVNDVDRDKINEIIRWCLAEEQMGPAKRLAMDFEERRNRTAWARFALRWSEGPTLDAMTHLLNAMQLQPTEAISLLLESNSPKALAMIADWAARIGGETLAPEWSDKLASRIEHELAMGNAASLRPCIRLCEQYPELAKAVFPRLEELTDSTSLDQELVTSVRSLLRRQSAFQLPELDYDKMDEYAAESGMANTGLAFGQRLRGKPPTIKRLEPWLHPSRTFDVMVPYVHPDLMSVEMDGPVNEHADDYSRIDGMRYLVARGDVVTVSRRRCNSADHEADWKMTSAYLGDDLVRDEAGPTSATFDRYRLYYAQGIPKGQRDLIVDDWLYEIRWIGRNHSRFPAYVRDILFSLKPRIVESDEESEESEGSTDDEAPKNPAQPPSKKDRPKAKLNAPGLPDRGDIDRNNS